MYFFVGFIYLFIFKDMVVLPVNVIFRLNCCTISKQYDFQ